MSRELNSIGSNLNQLSRTANQGGPVSGEDVRRVINAGRVQMEAVKGLYLRAVRATVKRAVAASLRRGGLDLTAGCGGQRPGRKRAGEVRYAHQHDSLAGLEEDRRGRLPKGGRKWTGSLGQRARASRGLPQAVVKISSYSHSAGAVWDRVNYVGRDGELEVEAPTGETLTQAELEERVEGWSAETGDRAGRQLSMNMVVSFPAGMDEAKATEAARQFFQEAFAENHDYVFAPHTDAKQFHVHVVVQSAGHDGKQLRIRRDDIQDLRLLLAEKAHEQGIELDASPRWARGLDAERQVGPEIEGITRRGATPALGQGESWSPERELAGAGRLSPDRRTQLEALVAVRRDRDPATARRHAAGVCAGGRERGGYNRAGGE